MAFTNPDAQNPLQEKNIHGTSPSRYSDTAEYGVSSTVPNATSGWAPKRNLPKINQVNKKEWLVLSEETKLEGKNPTDVHDDYDSLEYVQYATSNIYPTGSTKKRYKKGEIKG